VLFVTIEEAARTLISKSLARMVYEDSNRITPATSINNHTRREEWERTQPGNLEALEKATDRYAREIAPNLKYRQQAAQPTLLEIKEAARALKRKSGKTPVVMIDYLQLLAPEERYVNDKHAVDVNVMGLRQFAAGEGVAVVVISSLNRDSYTSGVELESYKESGAIEYGSDVVIGLQIPREIIEAAKDKAASEAAGKAAVREAVRRIKGQAARPVELVLLKNRGGALPAYDANPKYLFMAAASAFKELPASHRWSSEIQDVKEAIERAARRK
jgi:replicative DNA helicase